eukprot:COSAG06_NODE_502_length_14953_cov_15.585297_23_plen_120_part_00
MIILPRQARDKHEKSSKKYVFLRDLAQVALLFYISITVPIRAGFEVTVAAWTFAFWLDVAIDVYFVLDIALNFRTAYYTNGGVREDRPSYIARNYLKGWFTVDFASTLPLSYLLRSILV